MAAADSRDLEATRQDVVVRISKEAQPVIAEVYKEKGCGLLVSRDAIMAGNPAMDITSLVLTALDAKITTIAVERKPVAPAPQ
jgi:Skp family chaperone for outer membrane proteins